MKEPDRTPAQNALLGLCTTPEWEAALAELNTCRGGCGKPMPPGQSCNECAARAVAQWKEKKHGTKP